MLLLWKGVYPYEYKDDWEKFNETLSPEKENFYNNLNMENITDGDYTQFVNVLKQENNTMIFMFKVIHYC